MVMIEYFYWRSFFLSFIIHTLKLDIAFVQSFCLCINNFIWILRTLSTVLGDLHFIGRAVVILVLARCKENVNSTVETDNEETLLKLSIKSEQFSVRKLWLG